MFEIHRIYLEQEERIKEIKNCSGCNKKSVDLIYSHKYYTSLHASCTCKNIL